MRVSNNFCRGDDLIFWSNGRMRFSGQPDQQEVPGLAARGAGRKEPPQEPRATQGPLEGRRHEKKPLKNCWWFGRISGPLRKKAATAEELMGSDRGFGPQTLAEGKTFAQLPDRNGKTRFLFPWSIRVDASSHAISRMTRCATEGRCSCLLSSCTECSFT